MISLDIPVYLEQKIIDVSQNMGTTKNAFIIDAINFYFEHFKDTITNDEASYLSAPNIQTLAAIEELNSGKLKPLSLEEFKLELARLGSHSELSL